MSRTNVKGQAPMTTPTNNQNRAATLKNQQTGLARQDDDRSAQAANAAPELSQTDREMLESRRQAQRRAGMFQHLSSMPANDNMAAPIPLAGDELQRRA